MKRAISSEIGMALVITLVVGLLGASWFFTHDDIVEVPLLYKTYPVYSVTAPFGMMTLNGQAVLLSGTSFSSDEIYIVKYLDGNVLKTVRLDAIQSGIVVDGTFTLDEYKMAHYNTRTGENISWFLQDSPELQGGPEPNYPKFILHIPVLPTLNSTTTSWYIK